MAIPDSAFNVKILDMKKLPYMHQVTDTNIYESDKKNYHSKGLYSNEIFGAVGSDKRRNTFAYIDIKLPVIHPLIYKTLVRSRSLYEEIMSGKTYAVFDETLGDFVRSDAIDGETGYHFYFSYLNKIKLKDTGTRSRDQTIRLLEEMIEVSQVDKVLVIPAYYRDMEMDDGHPSSDEINDYYRTLISLSNTISGAMVKIDPSMADRVRYRIQLTFNELYQNLSDRIDGKRKLYLGKWASRRVADTSRNVITATSFKGRYLDDDTSYDVNDAIFGLYQHIKNFLPKAIHLLLNNDLLVDSFERHSDHDLIAIVCDVKSLEYKTIKVSGRVYDLFRTAEGLEKFINLYQHESNKHKPIMIDDQHCLLLTYEDGDVFRIFKDIEDLPQGYDIAKVRPTTYTEFLYYACISLDKEPVTITRYPISGQGSCPPCVARISTTTKDKKMYWLDDSWSRTDNVYPHYPILGEKTHESISPPVTVLAGQGADFDGDTNSSIGYMTDEAIQEQRSYLNSVRAYIDVTGKYSRSINVDTVKYIFHNLSTDPQ